MSRAARYLLGALIAGTALIIFSLVGFVLWSRANSQTIIGSVTVSGINLRGLEKAEAEARLAQLESEQAAAPIEVVVDGAATSLTVADFGYRINTAELVDLALWQERSGGFVDRWRRWLRSFYTDPPTVTLHPQSSIDQGAVMGFLDRMDLIHGLPPVEGQVRFQDGRPVPTYPAPGWQVDRSDADQRIAAAARTGGGTVHLNTVLVTPETEIDQIARSLARAENWISGPVVLTDPTGETELTFTAQEIATATLWEYNRATSPALALSIDPRLVTRKVAEIADRVGDPPVEAYLEVNDEDRVIVHPSQPGTVIDVVRTGELLERLAAGNTRKATLPIAEGVQPQVTTEDIEALEIRHLVSEYTTYHPCCAPRVNNIQLFADMVNDVLVPPGEQFSLNGHVGRRTQEDGFVEAGTLVKGELIDTIGGGVSQFATTFYNAVFWGGFKDIFHKTHSFYFSRYPEGIEATINWPEVDLVFLNDSSSHVLIRTTHTRTSITVKFFGNNDGRILVGSWREGAGRLDVISEGGPAARVVSARVSERFNELEPPEPLYRANPEVVPGDVGEVQTSAPGWTVRVVRTITQGEEVTEHIRNVRYLPRQEIIEVHPCVMGMLTDSGLVIPPEPDPTEPAPAADAVPVVCPGPEDEEPTVLPEGLYERFPELAPEDLGQTPIDEEGEGQTPIEEENGGQTPIEEEEVEPGDSEEGDQTPAPEEVPASDDGADQ